MRLDSGFTESGYRLLAEIPFKSFILGEVMPKKIGFDLICATANSDGSRIGRYGWAGDGEKLREVWLR